MSRLSEPRSPLEKISSPLNGEQVVVIAGNWDESGKFPMGNFSKDEVERVLENLERSEEGVELEEERGSHLGTISAGAALSVGVVLTARPWSGLPTLLTLVNALLCTCSC